MNGMGAGDVKLLAAIGAWLGPWWTFSTFALGAILGGVAAVVMILSTGRLRMAAANLNVLLTKCTNIQTLFSDFGGAKTFGATSQLLPYGVPLTAGTLVVLAGRMFGWWGG
jgi:prepilin peptidase CpaA